MDIDSSVYQVFYNVLCKKIKEKFKLKHNKLGNGKSKSLWNNFSKIDFTNFFDTEIQNTEYFYNKNREANRRDRDSIKVDERILQRAFLHLNSKIEVRKSLGEIVGNTNRAKFLCEEFEKEYANEIEENRAERVNRDLEFVIQPNKSHAIQINPLYAHSVSKLIREYFKNISESNYGLAWELWSDKGRKQKWDSDFDFFKKCQLSRVDVLDITDHELDNFYKLNCRILLEYNTPQYDFIDVDFKDYTINDIEKFASRIAVIKNSNEANETLIKNNKPLYTLFSSDHFTFDRNSTYVPKNFTLDEKTSILCNCTCVFENKWLIMSIDFDPNSDLSQKKKQHTDEGESLFV